LNPGLYSRAQNPRLGGTTVMWGGLFKIGSPCNRGNDRFEQILQ
jgi:hypothetical protein